MPSQSPNRENASPRKINPASCSQEELLAYLGTDPAMGLSPKEAERRRLRDPVEPLFSRTIPRFSSCLGRAFREPVLWMLLAVALIALFFDHVILGLFCLLLGGGHAVLCAYLWRRASRVNAAMQCYDAPLSRVLRGRRIRRVGAEAIVKGDVLLLYPGDVVPADCRLLRTDHFSVSERELDATDPSRPQIHLEKNADAAPDATGSFRLSPPNMVFAGGVVESGFALALAVAVGRYTHLGGLVGAVPPAHSNRRPALFKMGAKGLSVYNLALVILIIPVVAVSIFTLGDDHTFLDIFLSAVALASLGLSEHLLIKGTYITAHIRHEAATDRDRAATVDIKSNAIAEKLTTVTDLLLVGTAGLHDGILHPMRLQIGANTYHCTRPESDEVSAEVAELLYIYGAASAHLPATYPDVPGEDISSLIQALTEWAEVDREAVHLRVHDIIADRGGVSAVFPCAEGNRRMMIRCVTDFDALPIMPEGEKNCYHRAFCNARNTGYHAFFLVTETALDGEGRVRAMLTYSPRICPKALGDIRGMEAAGIRVSAFLREQAVENDRILAACGLLREDDVSTDLSCPAAEFLDIGRRAFVGCDETYIMDCIRTLQTNGRTVAVLSVDDRDLSLLHAADVAMTVAPSLYKMKGADLPEISESAPEALAVAGRDGRPHGILATDLCRRRADVIVRRTDRTGGGVCGIRRALLAADRMKNTLDFSVAYLLIVQCIRLTLSLIAACYGMTVLAAPGLLVSGILMDTAVVLAASRFPISAAPSPRRAWSDGLTAPWKTHGRHLIMAAAVSILAVSMVQIAHFAGVSLGNTAVYYAILCLLGLQFAVYVTGFGHAAGKEHRSGSTSFFVGLMLALFYMAGLAVALGAGLPPLWALLFPLIPALVYFLINSVFDRIHP